MLCQHRGSQTPQQAVWGAVSCGRAVFWLDPGAEAPPLFFD